MANNTYVLKLAIDPSNLFGGKLPNKAAGGKKDKSQQPSIFDLFFKHNGLKAPLKALSKIGIIGFAITAIVRLLQDILKSLTDASPMLQVITKLINTSVTFILRPIGDFIAFTLRPIAIYFLHAVAIPFYKEWRPLAQKLGEWLGIGTRNQFQVLTQNPPQSQNPTNPQTGKQIITQPLIKLTGYEAILQGMAEDLTIMWNGFMVGLGKLKKPFVDFGKWIGVFAVGIAPFFTTSLTGIKAISSFSTFIGEAFNKFWKLISPIFDGIFTAFNTLWTWIKPVFDGIFNSFNNLWIWAKPVFDGITNSFNNLWIWIKPVFDGIIGTFNNLWVWVKPVFDGIIGTFNTFWTWIKSPLDGIINIYNNLWNVIRPIFDGIIGTFNNLWILVKPVFDGIYNAFNTLWTWIKPVFDGIFTAFNTFWTWISPVVNGIFNSFNTFWAWIKAPLDGLFLEFNKFWTWIKAPLDGLFLEFNKFWGWITPVLTSIVTTFSSFFNSVFLVFSDIYGAFFDFYQFISPIFTIITNAFSSLLDSITNILSKIGINFGFNNNSSPQHSASSTNDKITIILKNGTGNTIEERVYNKGSGQSESDTFLNFNGGSTA